MFIVIHLTNYKQSITYLLYFVNTCYTFVHIIYTFVLLLYNNEKEAFNLLQIHDILENDSLSTDDKIIAI